MDLLQAMNTGHDGSLSTVHANSPRDVLSRLETMALMAGTELPMRAVREQIASALQLIVHQARLRDGSRKVTHITEVHGHGGRRDRLPGHLPLGAARRGQRGQGARRDPPTGLRPRVMETMEAQGVTLPPGLLG